MPGTRRSNRHIMPKNAESYYRNDDARYKRITKLEHLKDSNVVDLRETSNMRSCIPLTHFTVTPLQANNFFACQPCISPVDYDCPTGHLIMYPKPSEVQDQLIRILDKWLSEGARQLSSTTSGFYGTRHSSQWVLRGRWTGCNYFARLALAQVNAFPSVVFETIHMNRGSENDEEHFERDYIYEKAARWFEGSNGAVRLVIIALISQDPLLPWRSPLLPGWNPASNCHDWGFTPNEILHQSVEAIALNIIAQDRKSTAQIGVDIYLATQSYPNHRGYSEHAWHGVFNASGKQQPVDSRSVATDFVLSRIFPSLMTDQTGRALKELQFPTHEFNTTLFRAVTNDRYAQAERIARNAQQAVKLWRSKGYPQH